MTIHKDDSSVMATAIAFGAGIVAGLAAGVLLAPRSGRESRAHITNYIRACHAKVQQKIHRKKEIAKEGTGKLASTLSKVVQESQEALKEMQSKVTNSNTKNGKKS
jgi:gas vesicle protein